MILYAWLCFRWSIYWFCRRFSSFVRVFASCSDSALPERPDSKINRVMKGKLSMQSLDAHIRALSCARGTASCHFVDVVKHRCCYCTYCWCKAIDRQKQLWTWVKSRLSEAHARNKTVRRIERRFPFCCSWHNDERAVDLYCMSSTDSEKGTFHILVFMVGMSWSWLKPPDVKRNLWLTKFVN